VRELFLAFLAQHDDAAWLRAVDRIEHAIHPVDRAATRIWFHFYPLSLQHLMQRPDAADLARQMTLAGRWRLADRIDDSHRFLFGHQYWPHVKRVVLEYVDGPRAPGSLDLGAQIQEVAARAATAARTGVEDVTGIAAIALRTVQQTGPAAIAASPGHPVAAGMYSGRTADDVVTFRERQHRRGVLRFLTRGAEHSLVTFDERDPAARFPLVHSQHLTTAAALDRREFRLGDRRCSEGPIPVHCRSCSCGTCWVGILNGADKLSPMDERERAKLAECGVTSDTDQPSIRLACMAQAVGAVSIVIPPWNGLLGRVLSRVSAQIPSSR
jgi:ferredoxin